jgi:hypothetical protein
MVPKVHEQEAAMVPFAVDPPRKAHGLADVASTQLAAMVRPVSVHWGGTPALFPAKTGKLLDRSSGQAHVAVELVNIGPPAIQGRIWRPVV